MRPVRKEEFEIERVIDRMPLQTLQTLQTIALENTQRNDDHNGRTAYVKNDQPCQRLSFKARKCRQPDGALAQNQNLQRRSGRQPRQDTSMIVGRRTGGRIIGSWCCRGHGHTQPPTGGHHLQSCSGVWNRGTTTCSCTSVTSLLRALDAIVAYPQLSTGTALNAVTTTHADILDHRWLKPGPGFERPVSVRHAARTRRLEQCFYCPSVSRHGRRDGPRKKPSRPKVLVPGKERSWRRRGNVEVNNISVVYSRLS